MLPLHAIPARHQGGSRLAWKPIKEIENLRIKTHKIKPGPLAVGANPLAEIKGELLEVRGEIEPGKATEIARPCGVEVKYDVKKQEISVLGLKAPAPLQEGKLRLTALVDRTSLTLFAADGLTYMPMPVLVKPQDQSLALQAKGGAARLTALEVHELGSIWKPNKP